MSLKNSIGTKTEKWHHEREKHFFSSQQYFSIFDDERRKFFVTISTISATIGAFSFLLFGNDVLASAFLLILGDIALLLVILVSTFFYIQLIKHDSHNFHETYFSVFERLSENIDLGNKLRREEISEEEYKGKLVGRLSEVAEYKRPPLPSYGMHYLVYVIFFSALILIAVSLIDFNYLLKSS